jgi:hypothetical protein
MDADEKRDGNTDACRPLFFVRAVTTSIFHPDFIFRISSASICVHPRSSAANLTRTPQTMLGLGKKSSPSKLSREKALAMKPVRLVKQEPDEKGNLTVPITARKWWFFKLPDGATKTFELDEVGLFVWREIDGKNSVEIILRKLSNQYKIDLRQAEASTIAFLQMLTKRGLIGFPVEAEDGKKS